MAVLYVSSPAQLTRREIAYDNMDGVKSLSLFLHDVQRFVHLSEADHIFLLSNWTSVTWVPHQDGSRISNTDFTLL